MENLLVGGHVLEARKRVKKFWPNVDCISLRNGTRAGGISLARDPILCAIEPRYKLNLIEEVRWHTRQSELAGEESTLAGVYIVPRRIRDVVGVLTFASRYKNPTRPPSRDGFLQIRR